MLGFFLTQKKGPFDLLGGNLHFIFPNIHGKLNFQHLQHSLLQRKLLLGAYKDMSVILLIVLKSFIVGNGVKESEVNMRKGKVIFQPKIRNKQFLKKSCTVLYQRFKKNFCIKKFLQKFLPKTKIKKVSSRMINTLFHLRKPNYSFYPDSEHFCKVLKCSY